MEVLGSAAKLVPVGDAGDLATAMTEILENQQVWQERSRLSLERAREFSWERAARQTLAVYKSVVNDNKAQTPEERPVGASVFD
jgi:glycosyltransferase involved in cell wall biosynthesis